MKLYTVSHQGRTLVCRAEDGALRVLPYESMNALLTDDPAHRDAALRADAGEHLAFADVRILALNYQQHKAEAERFDADAFTRDNRAVYFTKRANRCPGPGEPIPGHWDIVESLDYEAELAVVLGRDACRVTEAEARDCVFVHHRQRRLRPEPPDRPQAVDLRQGPGRLRPHGSLPRDGGRVRLAPGSGHPMLCQR